MKNRISLHRMYLQLENKSLAEHN